ncbi:MAG: hypothetical protein KAU50_03980 [Candidatus Marinimicrobia bacterium]|nr:hypothetical protein [Candidatus Neomarinimicrobiota bacterium]
MNKLAVLMLSGLLLAGSALAQGQPSAAIGIQHTLFDLSNFAVLLMDEDAAELSLMPKTEIMLTRGAGAVSLLANFGYARAMSSYERDNSGDKYEEKSVIQAIDIKAGIKISGGSHQPGRGESYLYIMGGKRIGSQEYEEKDGDYEYDPDKDYVEYRNKLMSPWLASGGFGAEYFFNSHLALNMDLRADLIFVSATYEDDNGTDRTSTSMLIQTRPILGLSIYY